MLEFEKQPQDWRSQRSPKGREEGQHPALREESDERESSRERVESRNPRNPILSPRAV